MNKKYWKQAETLAKRPYQAHVFLDQTTDGEPVYVAVIPEMPGCSAHGDTVEEALAWLESAKADHIWFLLDQNLDVPEPQFVNAGIIFSAPHYDDENVADMAASGGIVSPAVTA